MLGGSLLAEGGYGCVFHPEITCAGRETKNKKYISKIQRNDFSARNEIFIGNILTKSTKKNINKFFAPVISQCPINVSKLKAEGVNDCNIIKKYKHDLFVKMKIKNIEGGILDTFITDNVNSSLILSSFVSLYNNILKGLSILIDNNIIHFDLKGQNIIYNKITGLPVIIDFGLSIPLKSLQTKKDFHNYFYIYAPEYYVWPLEVHYLNLLIHITNSPTSEDIKDLAHEYVSKNYALMTMSSKFRDNYEKMCVEELNKYSSISFEEVKKIILNFWKTWDNYSVSIMFVKLLYFLFESDDKQIIDNEFIIFLTKILLKNIHPDPNQRLSINKTISMMEKFIYNSRIDQLEVFESLLEQISTNKNTIDKRIIMNNKHMTLLTKKVTKNVL